MLSTLVGLLLRTTLGPVLQSTVNKSQDKKNQEKDKEGKKKDEKS